MRKFEKREAGNSESARISASLLNCESGSSRKLFRFARQPYDNMRVHQDHFRRFHSLAEMIGLTTSPVMAILPFIKPNISSRSASTGTSLATGLPCLVMITDSHFA